MDKLTNDTLTEAVTELCSAVTARGRMYVTARLKTVKQPDSQWVDGPPEWTPRVRLVTLHRDFSIISTDQYKWGHPNTGAKFPLPAIPLARGSLASDMFLRHTGYGAFPSEELIIAPRINGEWGIRTSGAHGQFNYEALINSNDLSRAFTGYSRHFPQGSGLLHLSQSALWFSLECRQDLEAQLLEGALALGAELLEGLDEPPQWSCLMKKIRSRVAERSQSLHSLQDVSVSDHGVLSGPGFRRPGSVN